jgi:CheY-like chemotaxis protein
MWQQRREKVILAIEAGQTGLSTRKLVLESFGYNVLAAASCSEAIRLLEEHSIDAALLDASANDIPLDKLSAHIKAKKGVPIVLVGDSAFIPNELRGTVDAAMEKLRDPHIVVEILDKLLNIADSRGADGKAIDKP